jgi:hypothetical protein
MCLSVCLAPLRFPEHTHTKRKILIRFLQPDLLAVAEAAILHCDAFKEAAADGISDADLQRELRKDPDLE